MTSSGRLAVLSVVVAIGALAAYVLLLRVAVVRNHPEGYVVAFALAMALAALAVGRAHTRRWPAWLALGLSSLLLVGGAWFNFVVARVPDAPTVLRVGERRPGRAGRSAPGDGRAGSRRSRALVLGQPELPGSARPGRRPSRRPRALVLTAGDRRRGCPRTAQKAA